MSEQTNPPAPANGDEAKQRANSAYIFTVVNGIMRWTYPGIGSFEVDPDEIKNPVKRRKVLLYGITQIVNDGGAENANKATGKVDPRTKFEKAKARRDRLMDNDRDDWKVRPGEAQVGAVSMVTQALCSLGNYQGIDVSTPELANAFVKRLADSPKFNLGGQMGKARNWLEANSKIIRAKIAELKAAEQPILDADAELAALNQPNEGEKAGE